LHRPKLSIRVSGQAIEADQGNWNAKMSAGYRYLPVCASEIPAFLTPDLQADGEPFPIDIFDRTQSEEVD
jgi:hypothetical protein